MKLRSLVLLATATLAFLPAARALPAAADIQKAFSALNTSRGDDGIALAEWEAASRVLFQDADRGKDGYLDRAEVGDANASTFSLADENRDQRLDLREYLRLRQATFNSADLDRDDRLTFFEYELFTLLSETGWTDSNRNGRLEPSELRAALARAFGQLDQDRDGKLRTAELGYLSLVQFKLSDQDRDSSLSQDEFVRGYLQVLGAL